MSDLQDIFSFSLLYGSYAVLYFCRKNYSTFLTFLISHEGLSTNDASLFGSTMEGFYGVAKLVAGPAVDSTSYPKTVLVLSVLIAGLCNLFLFAGSVIHLSFDLMLWALNGIAQSFAWPALSSIFLVKFKNSKMKSTLYSILSTSQNVGAGMTPVILSYIIEQKTGNNWRLATTIPGVTALVFSALLFIGLPSGTAKTGEKNKSHNALNVFSDLVRNKDIMLLSLGYVFITFIRTCFNDWSFVFLEMVHDIKIQDSRSFMGSFELGGFVGGLAIGPITDLLFARNRPLLLFLYSLCAMGSIFLIFEYKSFAQYGYFLVGFLTFGPHVMIGLLTREIFSAAPNSAGSFSKFISQMGGTLAGFPLSLILSSIKDLIKRSSKDIEQDSWYIIGMTLCVASFLGGFLFLFVRDPKRTVKEKVN